MLEPAEVHNRFCTTNSTSQHDKLCVHCTLCLHLRLDTNHPRHVHAGDLALRELPSPGKSGSMFFLSHDDRYMIKTMRKVRAHAWLPLRRQVLLRGLHILACWADFQRSGVTHAQDVVCRTHLTALVHFAALQCS